MARCRVVYYEDNGKYPAKDFVDSLDAKMQARFEKLLELLAANGHELREPHSAPLGDGIFELRAKADTNIARVLYFFVVGNCAVLTNGFTKKTQKTPKSVIEKAKKYKKSFIQRGKNNADI
jgi:phage-related protein